MTTYREYALQHPHIQIDKRVYDREITPEALTALELYNHLDDDIKDYYQYSDKMEAVVDYYDDNNVSIIASTTGGLTPIDVSCVFGDKNRISMEYVTDVTYAGDARWEFHNHADTSKNIDTFIQELNTVARDVIDIDERKNNVRKPGPLLFADDDVETTTRFDYLVFTERAKRNIEKQVEDKGLTVYHSDTTVNLPLSATARVVTKLDDGALQSEYIVGYNGMSDAIYASKHDHAQFVTECADGNINYEFDVFNTLSHEPATTLNEGLTNALRVLKPKIYDNHRWAMLPEYLPEFAEFNPVYDIPHALDVLDKNKCDVVVKADIWEGELRSAHARYVWGDSDKYKDARATFNLQEFEKPLEESWRFEGSCHENGVHAYHKCEGTFEDVLSGFDAFKTDFSTKVNDVYTSTIVQDLDDSLEL